MAFEESSGGNGMYMPVAPAYGYMGGNNNGNGFGSDGWWIILLLLCGWGGMGGYGGFGGGFGNMALGYDFPWILNGQNQTNNHISDGFRDSMLNDGISGIRDNLYGISTQLCNGFAGVNSSISNGFAQAEIAENGRQMANMNQMFGIQSALQQCCCDNRAATADLKYTIASEECATRTANTANTQAILDKLCALELDNAKREADQLRTELVFARGQASQVAQTAQITNDVYDRLKSCPVGTTPVFGNQPIFGCTSYVGGNSCGCGCGNF